jgi:hypothetical protein
MAVYKIKSEDKAAFLNRLEKLNINVNSNDLVNKTKLQDGKVISWFELTVTNPEHEQQINNIINQSPAINTISDMETTKKKLSKDELKEMVRQELQAVLAEKKKVKDEDKKDKLDENEMEEEGMEEEGMGDDKKITISLNEYIGDSSSYDLGRWAAEHFPAIWKQFQAISTVTNADGQQYVDFGNMFVMLCTVGTITVSVGLAVVKDQVVAAAKKIKNAAKSLFGGKVAEGEEGADPELEKALGELPKDTLAKIAK